VVFEVKSVGIVATQIINLNCYNVEKKLNIEKIEIENNI
jgi:predicted nucleic acid-binding protein